MRKQKTYVKINNLLRLLSSSAAVQQYKYEGGVDIVRVLGRRSELSLHNKLDVYKRQVQIHSHVSGNFHFRRPSATTNFCMCATP